MWSFVKEKDSSWARIIKQGAQQNEDLLHNLVTLGWWKDIYEVFGSI